MPEMHGKKQGDSNGLATQTSRAKAQAHGARECGRIEGAVPRSIDQPCTLRNHAAVSCHEQPQQDVTLNSLSVQGKGVSKGFVVVQHLRTFIGECGAKQANIFRSSRPHTFRTSGTGECEQHRKQQSRHPANLHT